MSILNMWEITPPATIITPRIVIESTDKNIECFIFKFIPWTTLIVCWLRAPLIIEGIPYTIKPKIPPKIISSINPTAVEESIRLYKPPIRKLIINIPQIENLVFGKVVIYLDKPATLLILDINFPLFYFYPLNLFNLKILYKYNYSFL